MPARLAGVTHTGTLKLCCAAAHVSGSRHAFDRMPKDIDMPGAHILAMGTSARQIWHISGPGRSFSSASFSTDS